MKILILNYEFPPLGTGGAGQSQEFAARYAKTNDVYFLTSGFKEFGICQYEGFTLERLQTGRKSTSRCSNWEMLKYIIQAWFQLPSILKKFQPDICHVFYVIPTGLLTFHPQLKKIPFVITSLGSDVPGHNPDRFRLLYLILTPVVRMIWKRASQIVANSTGLKEEINHVLPEAKVEVVQNGIELSHFPSNTLIRNNKIFTLLYVGRLIPLKRIEVTLQAVSRIIKKNATPIKFIIVGSGKQETYLREYAKSLGIESHVYFLGFVSLEQLYEEYKKADLYIQLSTAEGMSLSIMEAMASGLPIITTLVSGTKELINGNGEIVEADEKIVAEAILRFALNTERCKIFGEISKNLASTFDINTVTSQYLTLFKKSVPAN